MEQTVQVQTRCMPSRYNGVVLQSNGRWGAQIYEKSHRVGLGTFKDEEEAAKTCDIASLKFPGLDAITNNSRNKMKPYERDVIEALFLESHSKAEIVDMLRKHSYANELEIYKYKLYNGGAVGLDDGGKHYLDLRDTCSSWRELLFEKVATPSDVGRLNRMVIPKQHTEKHFQVHLCVGFGKGVLLKFEDEVGKVWRFGYCYWSRWIRFVKEKKLKVGDVVRFERSVGEDKKMFIYCRPRNLDISGIREMHSRVGDPLRTVQDHGAVRLFGVNISRKPVHCRE
ncbi:AP2/ERF and B3 domain-containing transcription repressor RAV2-like [Pyrus ussuriensis x Pyrus communis]|uniref:AP2/ERF and B3 domain-containing transcription repressor RAV2-like n=1 Tax=Pyrus ussuriensis x Pyrus communis TaxID=2448454 RepID=A0A5N5GDY2_9ROSA|nr:AP2/ERF and B3 domain-containing transcription repressor RAV2-like [Pyrus ussuriensis x Pyrus communis]